MTKYVNSARAFDAIECFETVDLLKHAQRYSPEAFLALRDYGKQGTIFGIARIEQMKRCNNGYADDYTRD